MDVVVTGATGFLGARLVETLLTRGHSVRALVRSSARAQAQLPASGALRIVSASLAPAEGLDEAMSGADAVVHCAGGGRARARDEIRRNNVETTANLLAACPNAGVRRFILISSIAAAGPSPDGHPRGVEAPCRPVTLYGRSKAEAEAMVLAAGPELSVTVLRPPALFGPGGVRTLGLFRGASRGWIALPAGVRTTSLLHLFDCAEAIETLLTESAAVGRIYEIDDGRNWAWTEVGALFAEIVGHPVRIVSVPNCALRLAGYVGELWSGCTGRGGWLHRDKVVEICQPHWVTDSGSMGPELGWQPRFPLPEGLRHTLTWYREMGWLR